MILVDNVEVFNFEGAIRGMRNPYNSWDKSDSEYHMANFCDCEFVVGDADLELMRKLYRAGAEHRKYLRQIFVSMDVVAPLYWWKEADQYRIGVTTNSCSTMHRIAAKPFDLDDFSHEHLLVNEKLNTIIQWLNDYREMYVNWVDSSIHVDDYGNAVKKKDIWWQMIQLLPSSYNQRRTITMNYENIVTIIKQRSGHKLDEWNGLIERLKELPLISEIMK